MELCVNINAEHLRPLHAYSLGKSFGLKSLHEIWI